MLHVLWERIPLQDYQLCFEGTGATQWGGAARGPSLQRTEGELDRPGIYLAEYHALRGILYSTTAGYLATLMYFYGYHRPSLAFMDRPLARLHHYFYPSAGYSTPVGLGAGLLYGGWAEAARLTEPSVREEKRKEMRAAKTAWSQLEQREAAQRARLRDSVPVWVRLLASLHLIDDPVEEQLREQRRRLRLPAAPASDGSAWEAFVRPYGVNWVAQRSRKVADARWYRDGVPADCELVLPPVVSQAVAATRPPASSAGASAAAPSPPAAPRYTKEQTDALLSHALSLRTDADTQRWTRTTGRFSLFGIATMVVAWNSGSLLFRMNMGLGAGVVAGAVVSAMKLDDIWTHV